MRIAILAPEYLPPWGGVGVYSYELVRELSLNKKLEIDVLTPRRGNLGIKDMQDNVSVHHITDANDTFFYNLKFQLGLAKQFPKLHKQRKYCQPRPD